jgi:hypothetical protein
MKLSCEHAIRKSFLRAFPLFAVMLLMAWAIPARAQTYSLSNIWAQVAQATLTTNTLDTGNNNRGAAYDAASDEVLVVNKSFPIISTYDGATGDLLVSNAVDVTGVTSGNFKISKIGFGTDGILYAANLQTPISTTSGYKLYAWTDFNDAPTNVFDSSAIDAIGVNLVGKRIGDTFAITGGGDNTMILAGVDASSEESTNFVLLSTVDGSNFTSSVLAVASGLPAPQGGVQFGLAFYTNNTFLVAPNGYNTLYLVQFSANFDSYGTNLVPATVLGSAALTGVYLDLSYDAGSGLLAAHGNSSSGITLYSLPANNFSALSVIATGNLSFPTSSSINGNETGDVALGGEGLTNDIYTLDTSAGLQGTAIGFAAAAEPPVFVTTPAGGTVYTNSDSFTFTVTAQGTPPLSYFWRYNSESNLATDTVISDATNSTYTISPLTVGDSGWYDVVVSNVAQAITSAPVELTVLEPLASVSVTPLWSLAADNSEPYLDTSYNTRGLAFDPSTMNVVVAEHQTANIYALDATNGQLNFVLTTPSTGLPEGSIFPVDQVGVADDGVLYVCNVSSYQPGQQTGSDDFAITRFDEVINPTNSDYNFEAAFTGDPGAAWPGNPGVSSGDRWGDSMAVRGAGTNTQILLGTYITIGANEFGTGPGTNVAILTTEDGTNFTPTTVAVTNAPDGFSYLGVAWGSNNTFWAKSPGFDLYEIQYNLVTGIGWVIQDFASTASAGSLSAVAGIGLDISNNILAGVNLGDTPNDLELFQIPTSGLPPEPYYQAFFPTNNPNLNGNAATTVKFPYIFSLDANNGIIGLKYSIPMLNFQITTESLTQNSFALTYQVAAGHTYQVQYSGTLPPGSGGWTNLGAAFMATASGAQSITNAAATDSAQFYRVVAQ